MKTALNVVLEVELEVGKFKKEAGGNLLNDHHLSGFFKVSVYIFEQASHLHILGKDVDKLGS